MRALPAAELLSFGFDRLMAWAIIRARYCFVTAELVDWLRQRIAGRPAIEIGAGQGDLGYHLGVPQVDLGRQREAWDAAGYGSNPLFHEQQPTNPPPDIHRLDAEEAVQRFRPAVVIAAWVTEPDHTPTAGGPTTLALRRAGIGVEEIRIIRAVETYIHIGNDVVHAAKRVYRLKHKVVRADWLVSRAFRQEKNSIRVWG